MLPFALGDQHKRPRQLHRLGGRQHHNGLDLRENVEKKKLREGMKNSSKTMCSPFPLDNQPRFHAGFTDSGVGSATMVLSCASQ